MKKQAQTKITAEAVLKAVEQGARSPTAVAKALGFKSGSSSIIKRITAVVPDIKARLKANQEKHDAEHTPASEAAYPIPDCTPYRRTSGYAQVFAILHHFRSGITKSDLLKRYQDWSRKPVKNCGFDVHVVISSREDGSSHKSAAKAAQGYWVERAGDLLKLRLVGEKK